MESSEVSALRSKVRAEKHDHWKARRHSAMNFNRPQISIEEDDMKDITLLEFRVLVESLKKEKNTKILYKIQKAFTLGEQYVAEFLRVNGALYALTGILTSQDADLQLAAAGCVTNLATGSHKTTFTSLKATAPYLITFLHGSNPLLKEQSLLALGNMASDCELCRKQLNSQGFLPAVTSLLKSPHDHVLAAVVFCLRCFTRYEQCYTRELLTLGAGQLLCELAKTQLPNVEITADVWFILFHFSSSIDLEEVKQCFMSQNFINATIELFWEHVNGDNVMVLTPLLRCLGNICTSPEAATIIINNSRFMPCIMMVMRNRYVHVRKEVFWMLTNLICNEEVREHVDIKMILDVLPEVLRAKEEVVIEILNFLCTLLSHGQTWVRQIAVSPVAECLPSLTTSPYSRVSQLASYAVQATH